MAGCSQSYYIGVCQHKPKTDLMPLNDVQALIGNNGWSSRSATGARLYHVGTIPNARGNIHCFDLRMMVGSSPRGFFPVAIYARRARRALPEQLQLGQSSWDILGTNLSYKVLINSFAPIVR